MKSTATRLPRHASLRGALHTWNLLAVVLYDREGASRRSLPPRAVDMQDWVAGTKWKVVFMLRSALGNMVTTSTISGESVVVTTTTAGVACVLAPRAPKRGAPAALAVATPPLTTDELVDMM